MEEFEKEIDEGGICGKSFFITFLAKKPKYNYDFEFWEKKYTQKLLYGKEPTFYLKQNEELIKKYENHNCLCVKFVYK
jgi:hypothetical protein